MRKRSVWYYAILGICVGLIVAELLKAVPPFVAAIIVGAWSIGCIGWAWHSLRQIRQHETEQREMRRHVNE